MSSLLLKWIANGVIAAVLLSTLWLAQAVPPEHSPRLLVAQFISPAESASAPATVRR